jgi:predicted nucleotidyltransferase
MGKNNSKINKLAMRKNILYLESELVPLVQKKLGSNIVTILITGGCATFDVVPGWSDYDLMVLVHDKEKVPKIDFQVLEKKYGIKPIQMTAKPWSSFLNRVAGNRKADRFINTSWLISMRTCCRVLAGKELAPLIPPIKTLLTRDLDCELRSSYLQKTNIALEWNILSAKNPKQWVNCIISLAHQSLLAKGVAVRKMDIPKALGQYYPDFKGTPLVVKALKIRATGKIPAINSSEGRQAKKLLVDFLKIYREYLFFPKK